MEPILAARGLVKRFGRVTALDNCDFELYPGEILGVIGDNGAGKSTLIKSLSGAEIPDEGEVFLEGEAVNFSSPIDARKAGIETVYQTLAMSPALAIADNMFMGREIRKKGLMGQLFRKLDHSKMQKIAHQKLTDLGIMTIQNINQAVETLSGGQRQGVAVARAAAFGSKVIIMDEPTAALGVRESRRVLDLILDVKSRGIPIILISHNMPHVFEVSDRIHIHRLGRRLCVIKPDDFSMSDAVAFMTGAKKPPAEILGEREWSSNDYPKAVFSDNISKKTDPLTASENTPSNHTLPNHKGLIWSSGTDEKINPTSLTTDNKNKKLTDQDISEKSDDNQSYSGSEPKSIPGLRWRQFDNPSGQHQKYPSFRPELLCRKELESGNWEIILNATEEAQPVSVHLEDRPLDLIEGRYKLKSLNGCLKVSSQEGREHIIIQLFEGNPLIFKLQKDWKGEGRRISRITNGHFIVIAPIEWQRFGQIPVKDEGCIDPNFRAHYFYQDPTTSDEVSGGFREWKGELISARIELEGSNIYDDSDQGMLFVGDPPNLKHSSQIEHARVGEEKKRGWGQNFNPAKESLSDLLDGREGRFYLRVYDKKGLLDSLAFRYFKDLSLIKVNGNEYVQGMKLIPGETGYPLTEISFLKRDGSIHIPEIIPLVEQKINPTGIVEVPPHPNSDLINCKLVSDKYNVNIVLDLPRIWWRFEGPNSYSNKWQDTPLVMTRKEFKDYAKSQAVLTVLSKCHSSVRAGFEDQLQEVFKRSSVDNRIKIPLNDFLDHDQIDRNQIKDTLFCVEWAGETLPLIRIPAESLPEIISFKLNPPEIEAGQEAILSWETRNTENISVRIEPAINSVEKSGSVRVNLAKSTNFKLRLIDSGTDVATKEAFVTVLKGPDNRKLMSPIELSEKVVGMQKNDLLEYYQGHLVSDTTEEAIQLRNATQFWKNEGIITFVQKRIKSDTCTYYAVRTSKKITKKCLENSNVLKINPIT